MKKGVPVIRVVPVIRSVRGGVGAGRGFFLPFIQHIFALFDFRICQRLVSPLLEHFPAFLNFRRCQSDAGFLQLRLDGFSRRNFPRLLGMNDTGMGGKEDYCNY